MIMAGRGKHLTDNESESKKVGALRPSEENSAVDLPSLVTKITEIDINDINPSLLLNIQNSLKQLFTSKESMKELLCDLHSKALHDSEFGEKLIVALEDISNFEVDGTLLRGELLFFIQNDFKSKDSISQSDPKMFINSVLLLGYIYDRFKVCGAPIVILGIALLEYLELLLKGGEEELKTLAKEIFLNGAKLSEVSNYELFVHNLRSTLISKDLSSSSKCWILLAIDFISNGFTPLKGATKEFYVKNLGEDFIKLESYIQVKISTPAKLPVSTDSKISQDSSHQKNKSFNSTTNKGDSFKKDFSKKFSDMSIKSGSSKKGKVQSPPGKNIKKDNWKTSGNASSGHDDRFEKEENFYGVQKPRQPKPFDQKKEFNDSKSISKEFDNFNTDSKTKSPKNETRD